MSERKDGGSAFPHMYDMHNASEQCFGSNDGMSLRDWFAGQALMGMCRAKKHEIGKAAMQLAAEAAYDYADAMIEARDKQ